MVKIIIDQSDSYVAEITEEELLELEADGNIDEMLGVWIQEGKATWKNGDINWY